MNVNEAIKMGLDTAEMISLHYLGDLTDEEMMKRPTPEANHIRWQVGHLIGSENQMIGMSVPGSMPELPAGFQDRYGKDQAKLDDPAKFDSKEDLLALYQVQRAATLKTLAEMTPEMLDQAADESMKDYAPTIGSAFVMQGTHWMMHAGQWAVIRRMLGRPPLF